MGEEVQVTPRTRFLMVLHTYWVILKSAQFVSLDGYSEIYSTYTQYLASVLIGIRSEIQVLMKIPRHPIKLR